MPTTGHGFLYPTSSGNTQIWTHIQNLADSFETALDTYETVSSWTPTWNIASGGGFTSVGGSGQNQGHYMRIGNWVWAQFRVELASGFAVDTGTYVLTLPVAAYVWGGAVIQGSVGTWIARNNSDPFHYGGPLGLWDSSGNYVSFGGSWDGTAPRSRIDSNDPIVWASGDILSGTLNYRAA